MTILIQEINTKPESDPYHLDTDGISQTVFWLDLESKTCGVGQEYRSNSTSSERWNGRELYWYVPGYPSDHDMREWIEDNMPMLEKIVSGHTVEWDGNNHKGYLSDAARQHVDDLEQELNSGYLGNYWETWSVDDWLDPVIGEITAEMTDERLVELVEEWQPEDHIVLVGRLDILEYITQVRDNLQLEFE